MISNRCTNVSPVYDDSLRGVVRYHIVCISILPPLVTGVYLYYPLALPVYNVVDDTVTNDIDTGGTWSCRYCYMSSYTHIDTVRMIDVKSFRHFSTNAVFSGAPFSLALRTHHMNKENSPRTVLLTPLPLESVKAV